MSRETLQPLRTMKACVHVDQTDGQEFYECEDCIHRTCEKTKDKVRLLTGGQIPGWFEEKLKKN